MKKDPYAPLRDTIGEQPEYRRSVEHKNADESVVKGYDAEFQAGVTMPGGFNRRVAEQVSISSGLSAFRRNHPMRVRQSQAPRYPVLAAQFG